MRLLGLAKQPRGRCFVESTDWGRSHSLPKMAWPQRQVRGWGCERPREGRSGFESGWAPSLRQGLSSGMGEMPRLPTAELVAAPRCGGLATRSLQESRLCRSLAGELPGSVRGVCH